MISGTDINDYTSDGFIQPDYRGLLPAHNSAKVIQTPKTNLPTKEYTGGSVSYYKVKIDSPLSGADAYTAECNDIIEALHMNYAEGNAFKAIWRRCAAKALGLSKAGYKDGLYDAEKVEFFGKRMVEQEKESRGG
jgi:hypothetical protein